MIIHNVLVMLGNRIYVDKEGKKHPLLDVAKTEKNIEDRGDNKYVFTTDHGEPYALKIIFQKISGTGKQTAINEFINEYAKHKKIIVAYDYNNKIVEYVAKHRAQIFREHFFLQDIISYRDQPKFELLSPSEMEMVKKEYNITDYTAEKMSRFDPVARYFGLKKGDIIRIIRPSPTSGEAIAYRIVI